MRGSRGCSKCCTVGAEIPCESRQGKISRQRHLHKSTEADSLPFSVYIRQCCCGKSSGKSLTVAAPGAAQSHTYSKSIQRPEHIQQHCCGESSGEVYQTSQQRLTHSHSQSEVGRVLWEVCRKESHSSCACGRQQSQQCLSGCALSSTHPHSLVNKIPLILRKS